MITLVALPALLASCHARISSRPVSSPAAPAGGCSVAACMPVTAHRMSPRSASSSIQPWVSAAGAAGCTSVSPGSDAASSQSFGLYFIVQRAQRVGAEVDRVLAVA